MRSEPCKAARYEFGGVRLGWQDRLGTLEAGKLADVVITASDPLANIRSLEDVRNIRIVIQDGRLVKG